MFTVRYQGWSGLKNGELLQTAENDGFGLFVTGDQTLSYEQNLAGRQIAIVVLSAIEWHIIYRNLKIIRAAVDAAAPGSLTIVDCGIFSSLLFLEACPLTTLSIYAGIGYARYSCIRYFANARQARISSSADSSPGCTPRPTLRRGELGRRVGRVGTCRTSDNVTSSRFRERMRPRKCPRSPITHLPQVPAAKTRAKTR